MITAFNPLAFQSNPLAFQVQVGPTPIPPYPDEYGAGGLNVYDPSVIAEYRKRIEQSQRDESQTRRKADKDELARIVAKSYNKALGIEEPEDTPPQETELLLPAIDEAKLAQQVLDQLAMLGLQASLRQIEIQMRLRKAEAMALAHRQDVEHRTRLLLASEANEDAELDAMMEDAERLFNEAKGMLN